MFEVKVSSDTINGLREDFQRLINLIGPPLEGAQLEASADAPAPVKRGRKSKADAPAELTAAAPELMAANAATTATAESLFGGPSEPAPTPPPKATQKDLIAAFRALAEAKGTDPIVALLKKHDAKSVAAIPEAKWAAAIADAQLAAK